MYPPIKECVQTVHSQLKFIRRKLLRPNNCKKWVHNQLLNFSVQAEVDQIASVNEPPVQFLI